MERPSPPTPSWDILVVEDDAAMRTLVGRVVKGEGHRVSEAPNARRALDQFRARRPDLVVIDVGLPDGDGFDLLAEIRAFSMAPVIMLTGRTAEADRVRGLDLGADDYLVKPVYPKELAARIRAIHRRVTSVGGSARLEFGELVVDCDAKQTLFSGVDLNLAPKEQELLECLAGSPRQTFSRHQLLEQVWGSMSVTQDAATVTEHMRRIRLKLAHLGGPDPITTVRGVGYRFEVDTSV